MYSHCSANGRADRMWVYISGRGAPDGEGFSRIAFFFAVMPLRYTLTRERAEEVIVGVLFWAS